MIRSTLTSLLVLLTVACTAGDPGSPTRVVLITLDTLRYDRFEGTAERPSMMPLTRAHAQRGLVFDRYYSVSGVTQPAHATLFSGLQPWEHGITRNGIVLPESLPNIVETFAQHGFATQAVVASFPLTRRFGFARGFERFTEDFSHNLSRNKALWEGHWTIEAGAFFAMADAVNRHALDAIDQSNARKQFYWFHYFDPHAPYGASSGGEVIRKRDILEGAKQGSDEAARVLARAQDRYDADVATLDRALDRILSRLEADAARIPTHILVVADHGESLGEGGSVGHGARLNEAELRVPAFILSPRVQSGTRSEIAATVDLAPTLLSLAGIDSSDMDFAGRDLTRDFSNDRPAFAIRRTSREPGQSEERLDGKRYSLEGLQFGVVDAAGAIHLGNREGLLENEIGLDRTRILKHFAAFQDALEKKEDAGPLSPEVRRGLEALGYVE